jgi:hypothetical protein
VTVREAQASSQRTPLEIALRHLGAQRYGKLVEFLEHAIDWPDDPDGAILAPFTQATAVLRDWSPSERAHALCALLEQAVAHPHVGSTPQSRHRRALQAAFRLPDKDVKNEWGASLTERFKQLRTPGGAFSDVTSTQPMEVAWKRGVERLAEHLERELKGLQTPEDWTRYRQSTRDVSSARSPALFRAPSEGAQKLVVNLAILTILMKGRAEHRRISERWITSHDHQGLKYFKTWAFSSASDLRDRDYTPTRALWGCRAEQVDEDGLPVTRLWFPQPLQAGQRAHFLTEAVHEDSKADVRGWANVDIDHYGIDPGELYDGVVPVSGLTIRIRFESGDLPTAVWWYAEQNERERYVAPPVDSPRRLTVVCGEVVKIFEQPCQPRESYGIAYMWAGVASERRRNESAGPP